MLLYDFWTIIIICNVYSNFTDELPYVELNIQFKLIDLPFFHVNSFLNFSRDLPYVYNFPPIINRAYEYVVLMICKIRIFKHLKPISAKYLGVIVRTPAQFKAFNLLPTALFNIQCCIVRTPKNSAVVFELTPKYFTGPKKVFFVHGDCCLLIETKANWGWMCRVRWPKSCLICIQLSGWEIGISFWLVCQSSEIHWKMLSLKV